MLDPEYNYYPISIALDTGEASATNPQANTPAVVVENSNILNSANGSVVGSGTLQSPNFSKGNAGWQINSNGDIEANDGNFRGDITGATGSFGGTVTVGSINIGGDDTTSAHIDTDGNFWAGESVANKLTAPARINNDGAATFTNVTITGGSVATSTLNKGLQNWTTNIVFTSASATQINWGTGAIKTQDGTTYTISAGNTGTMSALTYIYLDIAVSATVLQTTTTYSTATGDGKILVATAQNNTTGASVVPMDGSQPILDGAANIAALSITAGSIAASTITAAKMSVTDLSAISANIGSITAGSITVTTGGNTVALTPASATAFASGPTGAPTVTITQAGVLTATGAVINGSSILNQDIYGDGVDGDVTISGDTTLTVDKYYNNLTINTTKTLFSAGYRIFVKGTLTINGTGKIDNSGGNGGNGGNGHQGAGADGDGGTLGTAGAASAGGYFTAGVAGIAGQTGGISQPNNTAGAAGVAGTAGTATVNSAGTAGATGVGGGAGGQSDGGSRAGGSASGGGGGGGVTIPVSGIPRTSTEILTMRDFYAATPTKLTSSGSSGGSGSGGGGGGDTGIRGGGGGGSGGSGGTGGIMLIAAKTIVNAGTISCKGGTGGNGGDGGLGDNANPDYAGGGGGGGGGNGGTGGVIVLIYQSLTNTGTITVAGGTGGTKGNKGLKGGGTAADGSDGTVGSTGATGTLIQLQI